MIANVVSGRVDSKADDNVVSERLIPAFQRMDGYAGGYWLRRPGADEVLAVTFWESEQALQEALGDPLVREVTARTSSMFIDGPQIAAYQLVAQG